MIPDPLIVWESSDYYENLILITFFLRDNVTFLVKLSLSTDVSSIYVYRECNRL